MTSERRLTLIRHAKSSWDDRGLNDFERPLNARGLRDAPTMARRFAASLAREPVTALRLVSSPALRALTTAQVFADTLGIAHGDILLQAQIYEAMPGTLLEIVRAFDDADLHVLMFGHNPGFSDFARIMADCPFSEMPTCAAAHLRFVNDHWRDLNPGDGELLRYNVPKQPD
jgi:phosphohistidine phosphatase